ncbi:MAG: DUF4202 domain-containing protein [Flavobacteriales bacterium]|nr:DUF4202 domain-containing protein [Flavobacteriales bacterium]MCB9447170.1 DUF4202 domain-containing protein [Flavobacteriales bacterium]
MTATQNAFDRAVAQMDAVNATDPNRVSFNGAEYGDVQLHAKRLQQWIRKLNPHASEALLLASHCQHIRRWDIPRADFPMNRKGYLQWRSTLARHHADCSESILKEVGYDDDIIRQVRTINLKTNRATNPDVQTMEDALCLVFLEFEAARFAAGYADEKMMDILRKSWNKLSKRGREMALGLELDDHLASLIRRALEA